MLVHKQITLDQLVELMVRQIKRIEILNLHVANIHPQQLIPIITQMRHQTNRSSIISRIKVAKQMP